MWSSVLQIVAALVGFVSRLLGTGQTPGQRVKRLEDALAAEAKTRKAALDAEVEDARARGDRDAVDRLLREARGKFPGA